MRSERQVKTRDPGTIGGGSLGRASLDPELDLGEPAGQLVDREQTRKAWDWGERQVVFGHCGIGPLKIDEQSTRTASGAIRRRTVHGPYDSQLANFACGYARMVACTQMFAIALVVELAFGL